MTQQEFIEDFESKNNWLLRFENDFAIFTQNTWSSKVDFQLNIIFWFMEICNSKGIDIFNNTWMEIDSVNFGEGYDTSLLLTVKIKHDLKFED